MARADDPGPYSLAVLQALGAPQIFTRDPVVLKARYVAWFEAAAGRKLYPMQVEMLLIEMLAYAMSVMGEEAQMTAEQHLVAFADATGLERLAPNRGLVRLPAVAARTTIRFSIGAARTSSLVVPSGTAVGYGDGGLVFRTVSDGLIQAGDLTADVEAEASIAGLAGNGIDAGGLVAMTPAIAGVAAVNVTATSGGSDVEEVEAFRLRLANAWALVSKAGPRKGYRELVYGVSSAVVSVSIVRPAPCHIHVYALTAAGPAGTELKAAILAALDPETVRPQGDEVTAHDATAVDAAATLTVHVYGDDLDGPRDLARAAAEMVIDGWRRRLGTRIAPGDVVVAVKKVANVVDAALVGLDFDRLAETEYLGAVDLTVLVEAVDA